MIFLWKEKGSERQSNVAKISEYDIRGLSQDQVDFNDDVRTVLNFGKYQSQYLTSEPSFPGRRGESVFVESSGLLYQFVCRVDNTVTWLAITSANIP